MNNRRISISNPQRNQKNRVLKHRFRWQTSPKSESLEKILKSYNLIRLRKLVRTSIATTIQMTWEMAQPGATVKLRSQLLCHIQIKILFQLSHLMEEGDLCKLQGMRTLNR